MELEKYLDLQVETSSNYFLPALRLMEETVTEIGNVEDLRQETFRKQEELKLLLGQTEVMEQDTVKTKSIYDQSFLRIQKKMSAGFEPKSSILSAFDTLILNRYKVKVENELIRKELDLFENARKINQEGVLILESYKLVIRESMLSFDSLRMAVVALKPPIQSELENIQIQLEQLEKNYKKNGPKGFSKEFEIVFPDAFEEVNRNNLKAPVELQKSITVTDAIIGNEPLDRNLVPVSNQRNQEPNDSDPVFEVFEVDPEFPGGNGAMLDYLNQNLKYPQNAAEKGIEGKVYVRFIISSSGKIMEPQVQVGIVNCQECDQEAIRLVQNMPAWIPGRNDGKPVSCRYRAVIKFEI